jgi:hypothetical protein
MLEDSGITRKSLFMQSSTSNLWEIPSCRCNATHYIDIALFASPDPTPVQVRLKASTMERLLGLITQMRDQVLEKQAVVDDLRKDTERMLATFDTLIKRNKAIKSGQPPPEDSEVNEFPSNGSGIKV